MLVENVMYFILGLLVSGLLALIVMPAVWKRAVRLTKKRIEAATPITMAEFRADKDQLRAEFALSTRRLEMNVEALRRRLADQLRDINRKKSELGGMQGERDSHLQIVRELEERENELRRRVLELEKDGADLSQKLRMRERELGEKSSQLDAAREVIRSSATRQFTLDGKAISEDYNVAVEELIGAIETDRKRLGFLEDQNRSLIEQLEQANARAAEVNTQAAELRDNLAKRDDEATSSGAQLVAAEARIADAEDRVSHLLAETTRIVDEGSNERDMLLAEKLSIEDEMEKLRAQVADVEHTVMADWNTERMEQAHLRERLNDIATNVSRMVHALDGNGFQGGEEQSLFDRVQKFAADAEAQDERPEIRGPNPRRDEHAVSDRLKALREMQQGN